MNKNLNSRGIPKPKEVEPIKRVRDIDRIEQYLKGKKNRRDYMLFVVASMLVLGPETYSTLG